jgi:hypothetical protein
MANNLKDHLKEVADAIRAKKGTSDLINPQDFATEIEGISGGGSGEGGGSNWRYFDRTQKEPANEVGMQIALFTLFKDDSGIMPMSYAVAVHGNEFYKQATCLAIDLNMSFIVPDAPFSTIGEFLTAQGMDLDTIVASFNYTEITESEFYNLNA